MASKNGWLYWFDASFLSSIGCQCQEPVGSDFMHSNFFGANKGYEKKVKGCENFHRKFMGCENFHRKFKGCENIRRKFKGFEKFSLFSEKHSNRVSGLKKDRPLTA